MATGDLGGQWPRQTASHLPHRRVRAREGLQGPGQSLTTAGVDRTVLGRRAQAGPGQTHESVKCHR